MYDVFTNWMGEVLAGLTLLAAAFLWRWLRRRRADRAGTDVPPTAGAMRTYTLLGARAADGQPVHLPSSRPAGTRVTWTGPAGPERFELTDGLLPDGTYAAERTALYLR
ncbi:hypothetical protein ACFWSF_24225 [Streptomyces sp. NPDC058611]|uniref:hypothetical protein n=1 Tax=unclassified Streptomyces TaxID=2593676 RepID=UPI003652C4C7